ncbi:MAG: choice-of-anchor L domain-containing protein [Bacteroidota bacterium]
MKAKIFTLSLTCLFFITTGFGQSNLFIDNSFTADQMIMDFFNNSCVTPSNITFNGSPASIAYFEGANTNLGINAGILITSGDATMVADAASTFANTYHNTSGDTDLEALVGIATYDAAVLEFDITTTGGDLDFQYIFGSEEYPEFVNASFNDGFAFLISGPNIPGNANIAMVPGTSDAVSINNVNSGLNSQYYVDNLTAVDPDVAYDGLTTELQATFSAVDTETYHVKIVVADAADGVFDSGVFLGIESLCGQMMLTPPAIANIVVDGSTITLENDSRYATSWFWEFGDGTTSNERNPEPHTYTIPGTYEVKLTTQNYCCTDEFTTMVTVGTTSVEELHGNPFRLYPNPVSDRLFLENDGIDIKEVQLFDLKGQLICTTNGTIENGWDISQVDTGVYVVQVIAEEGVYTSRVVKR